METVEELKAEERKLFEDIVELEDFIASEDYALLKLDEQIQSVNLLEAMWDSHDKIHQKILTTIVKELPLDSERK